MFSAKTAQLPGSATRPAKTSDAAPAAAVAGKSERFFHLDALRGGLMFWGILVHTSTLAPVDPAHPAMASVIFRKFAEASGLVRMEAFFIISGFLAYMLLQKYGGAKTVKKRLVAIGVPFITALVLLNPLTNYLVFMFHNHTLSFADYLGGKGTEYAHGPGNWHLHLWFLIALFVFSLLAPLVGKVVDVLMQSSSARTPRAWTTGKLAPLVPGLKFFAICVMVSAACVGWRVVFELVKDLCTAQSGSLSGILGESNYAVLCSVAEQSEFVIRSIGNMLPYYALGMVLFASTELRAIVFRGRWFQTLLACSLLWLARPAAGENPGRLQEVLILVAQTYVALCLASMLFWLAQKLVKGESAVARFFSDAAYTVYLFHYLVIYLFAMFLREFIPVSGVMLSVAAAGTFLVTLCIHALVIQPVPVLAFLFNGKSPKRAK